jgi:hypothetical protein
MLRYNAEKALHNPWFPGSTLTAETFGTRRHLLTLSRAKRRNKTEAIIYYLSSYVDTHGLTNSL